MSDNPMVAANKTAFMAFPACGWSSLPRTPARVDMEDSMQKNSGKKKEKCKNCEGKGLVKNGDKKVKCQRCGGTGFKP
jgi:hypothetical protein